MTTTKAISTRTSHSNSKAQQSLDLAAVSRSGSSRGAELQITYEDIAALSRATRPIATGIRSGKLAGLLGQSRSRITVDDVEALTDRFFGAGPTFPLQRNVPDTTVRHGPLQRASKID
jgi:hypothetical protein